MASNGPKALEFTGQIGDGWVTIGLDPEHITSGIKIIQQAAKNAGRKLSKIYTTNLTSGCILRPGEDIMSPRVINQIDLSQYCCYILHGAPKIWDQVLLPPTRFRKQAEEYFKNHIMGMKTPLEKRFQEMHKGHLTFLQEGEEKYLNPDLIKAATLTGEPGEVRDRIRQLEDAGVTNIVSTSVEQTEENLLENLVVK